jgi:hypothetical protein
MNIIRYGGAYMEINTIINGSGTKEYSMTDSHGRPLRITTNENDILISLDEENSQANRRLTRQDFNELAKMINA